MMESMTAEDKARAAYDDEQFERVAAAQAEQAYEDAYEAWASDRRDDGEDDSREAYDDYLEGFFPED